MATRSHAPLIRLARFKVEELQKQMAEIERARASINDQIDRLEESVPEEQAIADENRDGYLAYGSYARSVIQRKDKLRTSLGEVDAQADAWKRPSPISRNTNCSKNDVCCAFRMRSRPPSKPRWTRSQARCDSERSKALSRHT